MQGCWKDIKRLTKKCFILVNIPVYWCYLYVAILWVVFRLYMSCRLSLFYPPVVYILIYSLVKAMYIEITLSKLSCYQSLLFKTLSQPTLSISLSLSHTHTHTHIQAFLIRWLRSRRQSRPLIPTLVASSRLDPLPVISS